MSAGQEQQTYAGDQLLQGFWRRAEELNVNSTTLRLVVSQIMATMALMLITSCKSYNEDEMIAIAHCALD